MTRQRTSADRQRDLAEAQALESEVAALLAADGRISNFVHTKQMDDLDYRFSVFGLQVRVDLKTKVQQSGIGLMRTVESLGGQIARENLFVLDETVFRRIVWHGGGGYLVVNDQPSNRWCVFGPWHLTLANKFRYQRSIATRSGANAFKGKLCLDLSSAAATSDRFNIEDLLETIKVSRRWASDDFEFIGSFPIPGEPTALGERSPKPHRLLSNFKMRGEHGNTNNQFRG